MGPLLPTNTSVSGTTTLTAVTAYWELKPWQYRNKLEFDRISQMDPLYDCANATSLSIGMAAAAALSLGAVSGAPAANALRAVVSANSGNTWLRQGIRFPHCALRCQS